MSSNTCKWYLSGFAVLVSLCSISQAIAAPMFFSANDLGSGFTSPFPGMFNSIAESNNWNSSANALGGYQTIDFETSSPLPPYSTSPQSSLLLAPGVTLSTSLAPGQFDVGTFTITTDNWFGTMTLNTTPGGSHYAALTSCSFGGLNCFTPSVYTFSFANPIEAFGLYITGRGQPFSSGPQELWFNDGQSWLQPLPYTPGVTGQFVGFTDAGAAISSVSILIGGSSFPIVPDSFAFDDVRWVSVSEPATLALLALGLASLAASRRRKLS